MRGEITMLKKILGTALSAALLLNSAGTSLAPVNAVSSEPYLNYAEALQKSLFFYECQQAGPLPDWNRVEWRADSTMIDEIKGGWYDAGDHVKFNLPMAYSASMLAWGLYQYPDGIEKCGEMTNYVNNLTFVLDYFADCDLGDEAVFQIGIGTIDHTWWGPVEMYQYGMEDAGTSYEAARATLKSSDGCSAVFAEMAAALAAGCAALDGRIDDAKRDDYLAHAKNLLKLADASKSDEVYNNSDAAGFYRSKHFYDELFYASNWMYIATSDKTYLDQAKRYIPNLIIENGSSELEYTWTQCWDDVQQGGLLLYAINTGEQTYIDRVKRHVDYAVNDLEKVDGVLSYIQNWGCARHATADAFIAAVACDTVFKDTDTSTYKKYYESQINYVLGDNPLGISYQIGYSDYSAHNAHHRTAHASWKNDLYIPENNRHTLYGALVGGPKLDGSYVDDRNDYINNEVTTDYNCGFTAILCKMIDEYGGETDPAFPPKEAHDGPEFYVEALDKGVSDSGMTVSLKLTNHSAWPARIQDNLSFRYYMDLSEVKAAGADPEQVVVRCDRNQSEMYSGKGFAPALVSEIKHYSGDIYYVEVTAPDGRIAMPVSEGMQQCEILLALVMPNYGSGWDATNDFSNKDILSANGKVTDEQGTTKGVMTPYVPVYINGELYYGIEPDGTSADGNASPQVTTAAPTVTTTTPVKPIVTTTTPVKTTEPDTDYVAGDANGDDIISIADPTLIMQAAANPNDYTVKNKKAADVIGGGDGVTSGDALAIQKYLANSEENPLPVD